MKIVYSEICRIASDLLTVFSFCRTLLFLAQKSAHIVERRVLALLLEYEQHLADELAGLGMDEDMAARLFVVVVGRGVGIFVALIDLAGGNAVAEHFGYIFERHFAPAHVDLTVVGNTVVDPVFKVVAVAPLVVEPRKAHAVFAPLSVVRAAVALIILDAAPECSCTVRKQATENKR